MKKDNVVRDKSYDFAIRVVNTYKAIVVEHKEYHLSKQLLKSGTSIGANIEEAIGGQSRKDFYAKLAISYKEARETHYWIRLLRDTHFLNDQIAESLINDTNELLRIIGSIQRSIRNS